MSNCFGPLHPRARKGLELITEGRYFEAHEALEDAWKAEEGDAKNLYRGILQIAVVYLHIKRRNFNGAVKVYDRSKKWLAHVPDICKGIFVAKVKADAAAAINEVLCLGIEQISDFDTSKLKPVLWSEDQIYLCDRCGNVMREHNCKITCPNCGNRFDCSDLNIYFD